MRYEYHCEREERAKQKSEKEMRYHKRVFTCTAFLLVTVLVTFFLLTGSSCGGSVPVSAGNDDVEQCTSSHSCSNAKEETANGFVSVGGCTIEVSGLSLKATREDVYEFFSFAGLIEHVQIIRIDEHVRAAYVTFKEAEAPMTAVSISETMILDKRVCIARWGHYEDEFDIRSRHSSSDRDEQELS